MLKGDSKRFKHLNKRLQISSSTLSKRIGEAKDLGLITPEIDDRETSVKNQYRITERGQYVVAKMERLEIIHAYRTMFDMQAQVEGGKQELVEWVENEGAKEELARRSDSDPYVDLLGEDVTIAPAKTLIETMTRNSLLRNDYLKDFSPRSYSLRC
ncbi:hypothetical protein C500_15370 [Natrialba magadii ATCC 43099]|uniref:HTH hxlR-type domain-containing protein n=1 Tax=Natrialba magadii (strain ATCC 43099 / DSM 3394 / CCM 3739 / CIP 104546 / IAM 13178 / JCM 8861 / NBRC 102185 / NCIMB 2190 / MS3) TaxID=547559 RepID=L9UNS6_NATMM|nr:winged helix-turn-helix transcriptional regulator [Natrialba magadii]ELY26555.1 hypothetical protein C500_15370 [Natrialba magadii ATCC 43099]